MAQMASYHTPDGERHHVELTNAQPPGHKLLLDYGRAGAPRVVAELVAGEGIKQAWAVLHAGGYLQRAAAGEPRLCRTLAGTEPSTPAPAALAKVGSALERWVIPDAPVPGGFAA